MSDVSFSRVSRQLPIALLDRFDDPQTIIQGNTSGTILAEARSLPFDVFPLRDYVAPGEKPTPSAATRVDDSRVPVIFASASHRLFPPRRARVQRRRR